MPTSREMLHSWTQGRLSGAIWRHYFRIARDSPRGNGDFSDKRHEPLGLSLAGFSDFWGFCRQRHHHLFKHRCDTTRSVELDKLAARSRISGSLMALKFQPTTRAAVSVSSASSSSLALNRSTSSDCCTDTSRLSPSRGATIWVANAQTA